MLRRVFWTFIGVGLFTIAPGASSAQATRPLAIEDYYRVLDLGAPQMSPDGRWVAYAVSRRIEATNGDSSEVWLVATDGTGAPRRLSATGTHATNPQWTAGALPFSASGTTRSVDPATQQDPVDIGAATGGGGRGGRAGGGGDQRLTSADGRATVVVRALAPPARAPAVQTEFEKRHEERFQGVQFDWLGFQRDGAPFPAPNNADPYVSPPQELVLVSGEGERQLTHLGLRPSS